MQRCPRFLLLILISASIGIGLITRLPAASVEALVEAAYTVRAGDTLTSIGIGQGVDDDALPDWIDAVSDLNDLATADTIRIGQELRLPAAPTWTATASSATTYRVKAGDTLSTIGDANGVGSDDMTDWLAATVRLNDLDDEDAIIVGQEIKLPARAVAARSGTTAPVSSATPAAATTTPYTVRDGDTLLDIAVKQGVSESALDSWTSSVVSLNKLASANALTVGVVLDLPVVAGRAQSPAPSTPTPAPSSTAGPTVTTGLSGSSSAVALRTYIVEAGETLSTIGDKEGVPAAALPSWMEQVASWNDLPASKTVIAGQELLLPQKPSATATPSASSAGIVASGPNLEQYSSGSCTYTVLPTDNWVEIARKLNVPEYSLNAWIEEVASLNALPNLLLPVGNGLIMPC